MTYTFQPHGVCSRQMQVEMDGNVIRSMSVMGGCNGNLQGISRLVEGRTAEEVIALLKGIHCGPRPTSCPDQLARGLEKILQERAEAPKSQEQPPAAGQA